MRRSLSLLLLLLLFSACDSTPIDEPNIVAGVDFDVLFAPATQAEKSAVLADWAARDVAAHGEVVEYSASAMMGQTDATVRVISHMVGSVKHYGAVVTPDDADPDSLPILLYLHGGDGGVSVDQEVLFILQVFADRADEFAVVVPSFRDESLRFDGRTWQSGGPASPWNYDVDDALALLNVAIALTPQVDESRIGVVGLSRGAGVALLASARDARIDRVAEFFGPTDFFGEFVQDVTEEALMGQPRNLPGLDYLNTNFLIPLSEGEATIQSLRPELVRRSAVLFVDRMPPVQAHHGRADTTVPVSQAEALIAAMNAAGKTPAEFSATLYDGGEHNPFTMTGSLDAAADFLSELIQ
jgi:dipeptidyl aminopeptidase/acylaminoacyl peptidase